MQYLFKSFKWLNLDTYIIIAVMNVHQNVNKEYKAPQRTT